MGEEARLLRNSRRLGCCATGDPETQGLAVTADVGCAYSKNLYQQGAAWKRWCRSRVVHAPVKCTPKVGTPNKEQAQRSILNASFEPGSGFDRGSESSSSEKEGNLEGTGGEGA